ncbi:polysaccharide deacetylase [Streptomyces sp. NPDC056188]|uniref:polysaccharide deacetylase family protein n=1 Tax=Streptomyces sp. NPDC056188 TaxID=3345740 RepID=UPI0035DB2115
MTSSMAWPKRFTSAASFTFDVDAESVVLGVNGALSARMSLMSHQRYGPTVGLARLLRVLRSCEVRGTFFVPGHTVERYPHEVEDILTAGHELAHHGYLHENLAGKSRQEEADILDRGLEVFDRYFGVTPTGYRAPHWEMNWHSPELLANRGFLYDSSLMCGDAPFELATPSGPIVELPINWTVDDWGQYCYLPEFSGSGQISSPKAVVDLWRDDFEATRREHGHWILTNHPFLSGRPSRAAALAGLMEHVQRQGDVWVAALGDVAEHTRSLGLAPVELTEPWLAPEPPAAGR